MRYNHRSGFVDDKGLPEIVESNVWAEGMLIDDGEIRLLRKVECLTQMLGDLLEAVSKILTPEEITSIIGDEWVPAPQYEEFG